MLWRAQGQVIYLKRWKGLHNDFALDSSNDPTSSSLNILKSSFYISDHRCRKGRNRVPLDGRDLALVNHSWLPTDHLRPKDMGKDVRPPTALEKVDADDARNLDVQASFFSSLAYRGLHRRLTEIDHTPWSPPTPPTVVLFHQQDFPCFIGNEGRGALPMGKGHSSTMPCGGLPPGCLGLS